MLAADAYNTHTLGAEVTLAGIRYKLINEVYDRVTGYRGTTAKGGDCKKATEAIHLG
ncbi:hypothetical protein HDE78_000587 [Rhodanobacter sp. K2T2]|nr:hypothetical protein [Rhodanobacter sp. K2T2]